MRKFFLLLAVLSLAVPTAFAGSVIYTDYNAWLAATLGDHDAFGPPENLGDLNVITQTGSFGPPQGTFTETFVWNDRLVVGGSVTTFFDGDGDAQIPYYAFGGFWDFAPAGWGDGLTLTLDNGQSFSICGDPNPVTEGCGLNGVMYIPDQSFFGVVTSPFTTLTISAGPLPQVAETFDLSQLDMVHTPEPATMLLLGAGFLGLGLVKRSRA